MPLAFCSCIKSISYTSYTVIYIFEPCHATLQDEIEQAVAAMGDSDAEAASQKDVDEHSDASSDFGLGQDRAEKPKAKAKATAKGEPKRSSTSGRGVRRDVADKDKEKSEKAEKAADQKTKQAMDQANKALTNLGVLSSLTLWQGSIKDSDITVRLDKAAASASELSQLAVASADPQLKSQLETLATTINKKVKVVTNTHSCMQEIRSSASVKHKTLPMLSEADFMQKLAKVCEVMEPECCSSLLLHLGQKLSEDRCT